MWLPIATFMTATALAGRRHALLPRWLTITTGLLAAALLAGLASLPVSSVGFFAIVLGFGWFIAVSIRLAWRPA
jgi:hypothetical protein